MKEDAWLDKLTMIIKKLRKVIARIFYSRDFDTLSAAILNATIRLPN